MGESKEFTPEEDKEIFDLRCKIQYLIIVLMLKTGVIQHALEYERFAPVFDLMTTGALSVKVDKDWSEVREEVRALIRGK